MSLIWRDEGEDVDDVSDAQAVVWFVAAAGLLGAAIALLS